MNNELHKIDKNEKLCHTEAYHAIMKAANNFSILSPNIPKVFLEIQQHLHGAFDNNIKEELEMNIEDLKFTYKGKGVN